MRGLGDGAAEELFHRLDEVRWDIEINERIGQERIDELWIEVARLKRALERLPEQVKSV